MARRPRTPIRSGVLRTGITRTVPASGLTIKRPPTPTPSGPVKPSTRPAPTPRTTPSVTTVRATKPVVGSTIFAGGMVTGRPIKTPAVVIGTKIDPSVLQPLLREASPLLLLPMRLEYRFVMRRKPVFRVDDLAALEGRKMILKDIDFATLRTANPATTSTARRRTVAAKTALKTSDAKTAEAKLAAFDTSVRGTAAISRFQPKAQEELWFRWFPDSDFAHEGIAPPSEEETEALARFRTEAGGADWWRLATPEASAAWQTLCQAIRPERALHLIRNAVPADADPDAVLGRIAALPRKVVLFGEVDGEIEKLAEGATIPAGGGDDEARVVYAPDAIEPGGWLASFNRAVELGMGVCIEDAGAIAKARAADWIIAVGLHSGDAGDEIEALLRDQVANGAFSVLPQDSPTNNTPAERTPYRAFRDDPVGFLDAATDLEQGRHTAGKDHAAALLASALGVSESELRRARNSADTGFEDARAMLRVIGPVLLDGALDGRTAFGGLDENAVIDVLAATMCSRGVLPAVRMGHNPYGIVPVTDTSELKIDEAMGFSENEQRVLGSLKNVGGFLGHFLVRTAKQGVPVINPDEPERTPERFEAILQNARVSRRLELYKGSNETPKALGCPYVKGREQKTWPSSYIKALRTTAMSSLPDPTSGDHSWPLLYRLARLAMTRNVTLVMQASGHLDKTKVGLAGFETLDLKSKIALVRDFEAVSGELGLATGGGKARRFGRSRPSTVRREAIILAQRLYKEFDAGLAQLEIVASRPGGTAQLETLMMEVFDLFQHRVDAWLTGTAWARLRKRREAGATGLDGGYFGLLGKLRDSDPDGGQDGYIQAPGIAQATTAAILRSAFRRHRADGAFDLDLSSARVRQAMGLIDQLAAGADLAMAIGLAAERRLRLLEPNASHVIPALRRAFPTRNPADNAGTGGASLARLDGLALLDARLSEVPVEARAPLTAIRSGLADDLDAIADVVMAEAVHHRTHGAAEAANAWLDVLSGGHIPGRPAFLRTQRPLQAASHRVSVVVPDIDPPENSAAATASPRRIAEPGLAHLANQITGALDNQQVSVTVGALDSEAEVRWTQRVGSDLGLEAIDLMIGGRSELQARLRAAFIEAWRDEAPALEPLGLIDGNRPVGEQVSLDFDFRDVDTLLTRLDALRKIVAQGRPLEPGDLQAAADAAAPPLDEAGEAAMLRTAADRLRRRLAGLAGTLGQDIVQLNTALGQVRSRRLALQNGLDNAPEAPQTLQARILAETARLTLAQTLRRAAAYGEPGALNCPGLAHLVRDETVLDRFDALSARLAAKQAALAAVPAPAAGAGTTALRDTIKTQVSALRAALDGDALPVLPPLPQPPAARPLVGGPSRFPNGFGDLREWAPVRSKIGLLGLALEPVQALALYAVERGATLTPEDENDADDARDEADAPKSLHFGRFIAEFAPGSDGRNMAGVVVDEWVENRPSQTQDAAMALNYNTPDAQAPNAMLLCVPPSPDWKNWSEERAAGMVREVIDLMRMRALSSDQRLIQTALSPQANRVPFKTTDGTAKPRVPEFQINWHVFAQDLTLTGALMEGLQVKQAFLGVDGAGVRMTGGFDAEGG